MCEGFINHRSLIIHKVYRSFLALDDVHEKNQLKLIDAYESETYPEHRQRMRSGRKAFMNNWNNLHSTAQPLIEVIENTDEVSNSKFENLMAAHSHAYSKQTK